MPISEGFIGQDFVYENTTGQSPWTTIQAARHVSDTVATDYTVTFEVPSYGEGGLLTFRHQLIRAAQTGTGETRTEGAASMNNIRIARTGVNTPVVVTKVDSLVNFRLRPGAEANYGVLELPENWLYAQWDDTDGLTTYRWQLGYLEGGLPPDDGGGDTAPGTYYNPGILSDTGTQRGTVTATQSGMTQQFTRTATVRATQSSYRQHFFAGTGRTTTATQSSMQQQFCAQGGS